MYGPIIFNRDLVETREEDKEYVTFGDDLIEGCEYASEADDDSSDSDELGVLDDNCFQQDEGEA